MTTDSKFITKHCPTIGTYEPLKRSNPMVWTLSRPRQELTGPLRSYTDASIMHHTDGTPAGIGWLVLDANSTVCAIGYDEFRGCPSTIFGEARAMRRGLEVASTFDVFEVFALTDNVTLKWVLDPTDDEHQPNEEIVDITDAIRDQLESFTLSNVRSVERDSVAAADKLAEYRPDKEPFDTTFGP